MLLSLAKHIPSNNRIERIWKIAQVDFQSRYYNDRLGLLWALIKPVFEAILYYFAFKILIGVGEEDFGLFLFGGIITWNVFSEGTTRSITLLSTKSYLIENVQFNHVDLYLSHAFSTFFGYTFNLSAFIGICLIMNQHITWEYLLLPILLLTIFLLIISFSFILSTLQPFVKDITHFWDMSMITGFWISGIFFQPQVVLDKVPLLIYADPFIGIIMNLRGIFIDSYQVDYFWLVYNLIFAIVLFFIGYAIFHRLQALALDKL